ncbi:MAG: kinase/pyrophosphorylase [Rhodospirillales bacterium]|nr:kinase/pyrophosphorylase [Rhodospirillales bacterium]MCB9997001.1 kinase/pyrophosphorylase [Rhodospirillales bacterium]
MTKKQPVKDFYLHLISDATGTTLQGLARACVAQFEGIDTVERFWPLVRTERQLERVLEDISEYPGPVFYTLMDKALRRKLEKRCRALEIPCMAVMDPLIKGLSSYLGLPPIGLPGLQHALDEAYFHRVDAVDFALSFDDGQNLDGIEDADVILVGVSRTSKTPTCIFLARRGIKAANVPYVPAVPFPEKLTQLKGPMIVALTESPERLVNLRRSRLKADEHDKNHGNNTYLDREKVEEEIRQARRYFTKNGWPIIDVTRRSIEETAAEIQLLLQKRDKKERTGDYAE